MPKRGYHHGNLKEALIEAALVLIREKGPTGFTLSKAAKRAGVPPAAVYRHFKGREDLIAEAALQGYRIFADLMEHAYRDGQPSALAAFEATGRAYLTFARVHPGHYIAMFESGISVNRTTELSHASQRARNVMDRAAQELCHNISEDRRPPHPRSAPIFGQCHMVLSNYSPAIQQARKADLRPKIYWKQGLVCICADWVCCHQIDRESPNGL